ncbi:MAG: hypothetical protein ABTQ31_17260 [Rhizobiaceae bacterium]
MLNSETASIAEVASALGRSEGWLRRHWLRLHQRDGFPRKISAGWVWPRRAVEVWLRSGGAAAPLPVPANDIAGAFDPIAAANQALRGRYGAPQ